MEIFTTKKYKLDEIPKGDYCYTILSTSSNEIKIKLCPYWSVDYTKPDQEYGCCALLNIKDWEDDTLLWDQVKECNINVGDEDQEVSND